MTQAEDPWAPLVGPFVDEHYGSLRGRVRTHVVDRHLRDHLPPPPARVVDVGGGAGDQCLPLARRGHEVVLVDPSPAMLGRAADRLRAEPAEVAGRVRLVEATGEDAPGVLGGDRFDGVLCHGVLPYLDDPSPLLDALAALLAPGAVLSLLVKNVDALAVRPALAGDWARALAAFEADREVNALGLETRGESVDGLRGRLGEREVDVVAWYGVRLFTDGWSSHDAVDEVAEPEVLAVELEASRRDPYRRLSRLLHVVGRARER